MFYHINGIVTDIAQNLAVVDCGGVGYALNTTANTISHLKIGDKSKLYTYLHVREEAFELFGFISLSEKRCFEMLLGVSGVGPKAALSVLSTGTPESLAISIINSDDRALTSAPGIGKKIAQRIILELRDKMAGDAQILGLSGSAAAAPGSARASTTRTDAAAALAVLGYAAAEINAALSAIDSDGLSVEDIVRQALRGMMGS